MYSSLFMYKMTWICFPKYQFPARVLSKRTVRTHPFPFSPLPSKLRRRFCATKGLPTFGSTSEDRSHLTSLSLVHTRFVPYRTSPLVCLLYHLFSDSGLPCVLTCVGISPRFSMLHTTVPGVAGKSPVPIVPVIMSNARGACHLANGQFDFVTGCKWEASC